MNNQDDPFNERQFLGEKSIEDKSHGSYSHDEESTMPWLGYIAVRIVDRKDPD